MTDTSPEISGAQIKVRQVSHYQVTWTGQGPGEEGMWTLQLVLDHGAEEQVMTVDGDDLDVLKDLLASAEQVFYDIDRQVLMFGTRAVGTRA